MAPCSGQPAPDRRATAVPPASSKARKQPNTPLPTGFRKPNSGGAAALGDWRGPMGPAAAMELPARPPRWKVDSPGRHRETPLTHFPISRRGGWLAVLLILTITGAGYFVWRTIRADHIAAAQAAN